MKNLKVFDWVLVVFAALCFIFSVFVFKEAFSAIVFCLFTLCIGWVLYKLFGTGTVEDWIFSFLGLICLIFGIFIFKQGWSAWTISLFFGCLGWTFCKLFGAKEPNIKV
jgi:uncharacterized membrane protein YjjB (DUF3815 family)